MSLLQAAGNGYLKSSYEGEKCIEVVYIELSAGWVLSRTAGYLIWTEAPQLLDRSTRTSQERIHCALKSTDSFHIPTYISPSLQSTTRVTRPLKCQLIEPQDHLCILNHSLMNGVLSISESRRSSFSQVFDYGPEEQDFIRSCQGFSPGGEMVAAWSWRTPSSSTLRKDASKFKSIPLNAFITQNRDSFTCTCPTVQWHTCVTVNYYNWVLRSL